MMKENTKISSNKSFGVVFFIVFLIIGFYPLLNDQDIRIWSLIVSFIFLILGFLNSNLLTPLNIAWNKIGTFLGIIISPIVLGVIFFLIVTPISLLMRLFQKDLLNLKYNKDKSYWIIRKGPKNKMKKQF
ncbi:MAG: hypothetical protein CMF54_07155 [Legionellales bacterium]|nr:hypothetical protein [Legionellales bacterium]